MSSPHVHRSSQVTRGDLAHNSWTWLATGLMGVFFAGVLAMGTAIGAFTYPVRAGAVAAAAIVGSAWLIWQRPPGIHDPANHLALLLASLLATGLLFAGQPGGGIAVGCFMFIGPLIAVRLQDRREIAWHLLVASVLAVGCAAFGFVDRSTVLLIAMAVPITWVLGFCVVLVMERVEVQGAELAALVRTDPATGAANRRALEELLDRSAPTRVRAGASVGLVVVRLAPMLGPAPEHAAPVAEAVAVEHARAIVGALRDSAPAGAVVGRLGDDEYVVALVDRRASDLDAAMAAVRRALDAAGIAAVTRAASSPDDGATLGALLAATDQHTKPSSVTQRSQSA